VLIIISQLPLIIIIIIIIIIPCAYLLAWEYSARRNCFPRLFARLLKYFSHPMRYYTG